jgi:hypothetical protein
MTRNRTHDRQRRAPGRSARAREPYKCWRIISTPPIQMTSGQASHPTANARWRDYSDPPLDGKRAPRPPSHYV